MSWPWKRKPEPIEGSTAYADLARACDAYAEAYREASKGSGFRDPRGDLCLRINLDRLSKEVRAQAERITPLI